MTGRDSIDHAVRTLLEEELGGRTPPDLCGEILARAVAAAEANGEPELVGAGSGVGRGDALDDALGRQRGLLREAWGFLSDHGKWWLLPILIVVGLVGFALVLGSTGAAPFIYSMF